MRSPFIVLIGAIAEHWSGLPVCLGWWALAITVALAAFFLLVPIYIRRRIREEIDELRRK